jgi:hypothetical protein
MDTTIRTAIPTTDRIGIMATIGLTTTTDTAISAITATTGILTVITAIIGNEMT